MKVIRFCMLVVVAWMATFAAAAETVWNADNVPVPYLKDSTQYVSDPDNYVSPVLRDSANAYLRRLNVECGVQNVLIIVGKVANQDAFRMAQDVGNRYGIGYKKTRRGLVVVIAVEDHKYFIAPGMGLEGELTDVDCDDIARACIVANMKNDRPGEAVLETSRAIYNKVKSGRTGISQIDDGGMGEDDWLAVVVLLVIFFGIPVYMLVRYVLECLGIVKKRQQTGRRDRRNHDDFFPPFFMGGGGFSGGGGGSGFSGGSFGGGSFGGGGSGGSW